MVTKPFQLFCLQCFCLFKKLDLFEQVAILAMETEEENLSEERKLSLGQEVPVLQVFQINFVAKINTDMAHFGILPELLSKLQALLHHLLRHGRTRQGAPHKAKVAT